MGNIDKFTPSTRQKWEEYFMEICEVVAKRSTCDRAFVGAIIVNNENRIVATGYNGSVGSGGSHCIDSGHIMRDNHCIATVHAEINCIAYCAREGIAIKDCSIYITHFPCINCTKAIVQSGIKEVYYKHSYRVDEDALNFLVSNGITIKQIR